MSLQNIICFQLKQLVRNLFSIMMRRIKCPAILRHNQSSTTTTHVSLCTHIHVLSHCVKLTAQCLHHHDILACLAHSDFLSPVWLAWQRRACCKREMPRHMFAADLPMLAVSAATTPWNKMWDCTERPPTCKANSACLEHHSCDQASWTWGMSAGMQHVNNCTWSVLQWLTPLQKPRTLECFLCPETTAQHDHVQSAVSTTKHWTMKCST